jgi:hypothetical protein
LLRLSQDRELLAKMGVDARRRYSKHPTWGKSVARVRRFLETLVDPLNQRTNISP